MADEASDVPISAEEVTAQLPYVQRAMTAADDETRAAALADGLLAFGDRFVVLLRLAATHAPDPALLEDLTTRAATLHLGWLKGQRLTDRADEPERRAHAARRLLDPAAPLADLAHYAAHAVLDLPDGHPLRDADRARAVLLAQLRRFRAQPEARWVFVSTALGLAYDHDAIPDNERDEWDAWAESVASRIEPEDAVALWMAIERHSLDHVDQGPAWRARADRARARINALTLHTRDAALRDLSVISTDVVEDDQDAIADRLQAALDSEQFAPHVQLMMAAYQARLRLRQGDDARVDALLTPRLDAYESAYVTSVRPEERAETGARFGEACALLAFAHARQDRWADAVVAIERGKCVRQRYARALRRHPDLAHLLAFEADLYAAERGVPTERPPASRRREDDWLGHDLAPDAALREAYRQALPRLDASSWQMPALDDVADALRPGEVLLSLGQTWAGLLAALIARGDATPAWTQWRRDVDESWILARLAADEEGRDGLLVELERVTDLPAQRAALERLLTDLDEALGAPVAAAMRQLGAHRLVVVPHRFLRLVPLWALPSWRDFDVRMAPDLSSIVSGAVVAPVSRRALLVGNPTGDLPLTPTETVVTATHLQDAGVESHDLRGPTATEEAVTAALPGVGILHFAGHGHASLTNPTLSGLLVHPDWQAAGLGGAADLVALADTTPEAPRLTIDHDAGDPHRRLYLDHARSGTVFVDEWHGAVTLAGELWRVGDILVQGSLDGCGLAFLCACSSGLGALTEVEEATGVPASLDLAGVRTVVATGWPVADALALLFADEFYRRALGGAPVAIDVVNCVRTAAATLRTMASDDAARRLEALADRAPDATGRFRLRATARRIASGPPLPFTHPFDWGAFHVTGAAELQFAER